MARRPKRIRQPGVNPQAEKAAREQEDQMSGLADEPVAETQAEPSGEATEPKAEQETVETKADTQEVKPKEPAQDQETVEETVNEAPREETHEADSNAPESESTENEKVEGKPTEEPAEDHNKESHENNHESQEEQNSPNDDENFPFSDAPPPASEDDYLKENNEQPERLSLLDRIAQEEAFTKKAEEEKNKSLQSLLEEIDALPEEEKKQIITQLTEWNQDFKGNESSKPKNDGTNGLEKLIEENKAKAEQEAAKKEAESTTPESEKSEEKEVEENQTENPKSEEEPESEKKEDAQKSEEAPKVKESEKTEPKNETSSPEAASIDSPMSSNDVRGGRVIRQRPASVGQQDDESPYYRRNQRQSGGYNQNLQQEKETQYQSFGNAENNIQADRPMISTSYTPRKIVPEPSFTRKTNDRFTDGMSRDAILLRKMVDTRNRGVGELNEIYNEVGISDILSNQSITALEKEERISEILKQNPSISKRAKQIAELDNDIIDRNKIAMKDLKIAKKRGIDTTPIENSLHDTYSQGIETPIYSPPKTGLKEAAAKLMESIKKAIEALMKIFVKREPSSPNKSGPEM